MNEEDQDWYDRISTQEQVAYNKGFDDASEAAVSSIMGALFEALKHGNEQHQAWLKEAIECWCNGRPVPPPNV